MSHPISEHYLTVPRTARYYTIGEMGPDIREVWFVLHGHGQLGERFIRDFRSIESPSRLIIAPEGLNRYYLQGTRGHVGATWMTKADRESEITDYVRYLDVLYHELLSCVDTSGLRITVLGFSQGTATAGRWAALGHSRIDRLLLWGGLLPPDLGENLTNLTPLDITYILGSHDEYANPEPIAGQRQLLEQSGIPYRWVDFEGGHEINGEVLSGLSS